MRTTVVFLVLLLGHQAGWAQATFGNTHQRVIGSLDVVRFLFAKFRMPPKWHRQYPCEHLNYPEHLILGSVLAEEGSRLVDKPEPEFVGWYLSCVERLAKEKTSWEWDNVDTSEDYEAQMGRKEAFVGRALWDYLMARSRTTAIMFADDILREDYVRFDSLMNHDWSEVPKHIKEATIEHLVGFFVGPDFILEEMGFIGRNSFLQGRPETLDDLGALLIALPRPEAPDGFNNIANALTFYSVAIVSVGELLIY